MPYLQLDVNGSYPTELKKRLVQEMSTTYADMMTVDIRRISIAIRELGEGACGALLMMNQSLSLC